MHFQDEPKQKDTVNEEITFEEIRSSYEAILSHPDYQDGMNSIWDVRNADASKLDTHEIIRIASYFESKLRNRPEYKVAIVVSRDLEYGLSKIYQVASADLPAKIRVFDNFEKAKKWGIGAE